MVKRGVRRRINAPREALTPSGFDARKLNTRGTRFVRTPNAREGKRRLTEAKGREAKDRDQALERRSVHGVREEYTDFTPKGSTSCIGPGVNA